MSRYRTDLTPTTSSSAARMNVRGGNLYDYYAGYVPEADRAPLQALLDEPDTQEQP